MPSISQPGRVASDKNTQQEITDAVFTTGSAQDPANLKAAAVDWSSKTVDVFGQEGRGSVLVDVSGSGYFSLVYGPTDRNNDPEIRFSIDGSTVFDRFVRQNDGPLIADGTQGRSGPFHYPLPMRFDSGFEFEEKSGVNTFVHGVLLLD